MALEIIQGANYIYTFRIRDKDDDPVPLDAITDVIICFVQGSVSVVHKQSDGDVSIVGNAVLGKISGELDTDETEGFKAGKSIDVEVTVRHSSGAVDKAQALGLYKALAKKCTA